MNQYRKVRNWRDITLRTHERWTEREDIALINLMNDPDVRNDQERATLLNFKFNNNRTDKAVAIRIHKLRNPTSRNLILRVRKMGELGWIMPGGRNHAG